MTTKEVESVALVTASEANSLRETREREPEQSSKLARLAAFTPTNLTEAIALSKLIASSELAPKDYKGKAGNVLIAMQLGAELGVPPMSALANISVINGRAAVWGDLALALVQAHPDYEAHKEFLEGTGDTRRAVFQIKRRGQEWHQQTFSVQDAKTAKLWGKRGYNGQDTPWITNPDRMLSMRARGFGLRDKFADALKGLRLAEEVMDIPPEKGAKEGGTLDVNREMTTMTASSEPNRGHGNEGFIQQPPLSQPAGIDQTVKKQDDTICADCHGLNGKHKADCFYAEEVKTGSNDQCSECKAKGGHLPKCSKHAEWKASLGKKGIADAQPSQDAVKAMQAASSATEVAAGLQRVACRILNVVVREKAPRRITVVDNNGQWEMSCWHQSMYPVLDSLKGGDLAIFDVAVKEKAGKTYTNLEGIIEVNGKAFVNNAPAEEAEFPE